MWLVVYQDISHMFCTPMRKSKESIDDYDTDFSRKCNLEVKKVWLSITVLWRFDDYESGNDWN